VLASWAEAPRKIVIGQLRSYPAAKARFPHRLTSSTFSSVSNQVNLQDENFLTWAPLEYPNLKIKLCSLACNLAFCI
jgi:hypothetical protein